MWICFAIIQNTIFIFALCFAFYVCYACIISYLYK
nr:MAG TPA: hypothetical protein [Caudoviricetes sp.]